MEMTRKAVWQKAGKRLCLLLLAGTAACYYGETEAVEDEVVTEEVAVASAPEEVEFIPPPITTFYDVWDVDDDGYLSEEEFTVGFYEIWDMNKDGRISMGEWTAVVSDYGNGIDAADWRPWDTDGDGFIERAEFDADFAGMGWYTAWDTDGDGLIEKHEYTTGTSKLRNTNGDTLPDDAEHVE